jgi:predicted dehydrogenase
MGVVGAGNISRMHINGILESPDAELVALCDVDTDMLEKKGDIYGIAKKYLFSDYNDLLACPDVDAITICTPNYMHYPVAIAAVEHGKPFVVEKPVTMTYEQASDLKAKAEKANVAHMVDFTFRFKSAARHAKWMIEQGYLGKIRHIYAEYLQCMNVSDATPYSWKNSLEMAGTGVLNNLGSHVVDLIRFMVGDFKKVCGHAGVCIPERKDAAGVARTVDAYDYSHTLGELDCGASVTLTLTKMAYARKNYQKIEVYGDKGAMVYCIDKDESIDVCIGDVYERGGDFHRITLPPQNFPGMIQSFLDIVLGRGKGLAPVMEDGRINQRVLDAIDESVKLQKWVIIQKD